MSFESRLPSTDAPALERAMTHYRELFEGDEDVFPGSVLAMEPGDSGYCAYWAVEVDSSGQYWLGPLFRVDSHPSDETVLITRDKDGFKADFSQRTVKGRNRFYDSVVSANFIEPGGFYGLPVAEVNGDAEQLPGFYCDENGQPPSAGENGEHYTDFDVPDQFAAVRAIYRQYGLPIPDAFRPPFPGNSNN